MITNQLLYQLSYTGFIFRVGANEIYKLNFDILNDIYAKKFSLKKQKRGFLNDAALPVWTNTIVTF